MRAIKNQEYKTLKTKKKRLLFCMPQIIMGGVEKVLLIYMEQLQALGEYDCGVVCLTPVTDSFFLNFFEKHHFPLHIIGVTIPSKTGKGFWARRVREYHKFCIWRTVKRTLPVFVAQYDVIIDFHNFSFAPYLYSFSQQKIGFCHGSKRYLYEKKHFQLYNSIVCLSQAFEYGFKRLYPTLSSKIHCIYNPCSIDKIRSLSLKEEWAFPHPYFVAVQRLDADKDVLTIIRAFQIFHKKHQEYYLIIVGEGPLRREFEEISARDAMEESIIFTGQLDNPYPVIRQAEALILSSTKITGEGFGQVLVEAQALGVPAVSSDVPSGPAEVLMEGQAGYLFEPENPGALAQVLEQLVKFSDERAERMAKATEGLSRFEPKECISHFVDLIN